MTERDPVHRLPVEVGGIGVTGLFRDFIRACERSLGPAVDVVFDRLVRQRSWCRHLRARLVERLAFEPLLVGPIEQAAGFLEASDDGGDGRQPVSAVVFVDDGRHGSPHSCVAGWEGCRAARNAAASDALDAAVKIAFLSAFKTASQDARYCA